MAEWEGKESTEEQIEPKREAQPEEQKDECFIWVGLLNLALGVANDGQRS